MTSNAKWTKPATLMISVASSLGLLAFACTVTTAPTPTSASGDSGASSGSPVTNPSDSGSPASSACPGNTKQQKDLVNATCQSCLSTNCCTQLTTCFNIVPTADPDAGGTTLADCNLYSSCIAQCITMSD